MEVTIFKGPRVSLTRLVSRTRIARDQLRKEYVGLVHEALKIIATLDVRDKRGHIIESGSSVVDKILAMERKGNDTTKEAEIVGNDKWLRLKELWSRMRDIENQDQNLIRQTKSNIIKES